MISLLLLGFLIVLLVSAWISMRKVASLHIRWQVLTAIPLVCLVSLVPIQAFSGYSPASATVLQVVVAAACVAWFPLIFLLWQMRRTKFFVGLLVPVLFLIPNFVVALAALSTTLINMATLPAAEGRISPIASYRVVQYPLLLGFATPPYTYEIYENPSRLPFIWKKVAEGTVPCGKGFDAKGVLIAADANDHMVVLSCSKPEPGFSPIQIPIG